MTEQPPKLSRSEWEQWRINENVILASCKQLRVLKENLPEAILSLVDQADMAKEQLEVLKWQHSQQHHSTEGGIL